MGQSVWKGAVVVGVSRGYHFPWPQISTQPLLCRHITKPNPKTDPNPHRHLTSLTLTPPSPLLLLDVPAVPPEETLEGLEEELKRMTKESDKFLSELEPLLSAGHDAISLSLVEYTEVSQGQEGSPERGRLRVGA